MGGSYSPNVQVARISSPISHWLKVHLLPSLDEKMTRTMVSGGSSTFQEQLSERGTQNFGGKLATEDKGQRWDPEYLGVKLQMVHQRGQSLIRAPETQAGRKKRQPNREVILKLRLRTQR